jgi:hypothetical protein
MKSKYFEFQANSITNKITNQNTWQKDDEKEVPPS